MISISIHQNLNLFETKPQSMRVSCKAKNQYLGTRHESFCSISKIIQSANRLNNAKITFNLKDTYRADGNLASVYAALSYNLSKSKNTLTIIPRKAISTKLSISKDLLGYRCSWEEYLDLAFWSGGTKVHAFDPYEFDRFKDYLIHDAFGQAWKDILSDYTRSSVEAFLMELFQNASEHSNSHSPIFISSSYRSQMLRFTIVDCGEGFLRQIRKVDSEVLTEKQAIMWALRGKSVKGEGEGNEVLQELGKFCSDNGGELLIVSGCASVSYNKNKCFEFSSLPAPFRGAIINLSIRVQPNLNLPS